MSTLSDLANEVQKAVYGKDLRRAVANFIEYVPNVRSGTYTGLAEQIANIRSNRLYANVVGSISTAFYKIGTVLEDNDIKSAANNLVNLVIGHPLKIAILEIIDLIISDIDGTVYRITITGASHCTIENWRTTIESGSPYTNLFTADTGWKFTNVSVSMGGATITEGVTVSDTSITISISSVSGDLNISMSMVQDQPGPTPTGETETFTVTANNTRLVSIARQKDFVPGKISVARQDSPAYEGDYPYAVIKSFTVTDLTNIDRTETETIEPHDTQMNTDSFQVSITASAFEIKTLPGGRTPPLYYNELSTAWSGVQLSGTYTIILYENAT